MSANAVPLRIMIVSYRTPELAQRCAESALQNVDIPFYLEIADTSDGPGALRDAPPWVPIRYFTNIGYGAAVNELYFNPASAEAAPPTAPLLLICNADVEFPEGGIGELVGFFGEVRDLAIVGPRQVTPAGLIAHAGIGKIGATDGGRGYAEPDTGQYAERLISVEQISGSVMFIRTTFFERVGGMPPLRLYFEDSWLCAKAKELGYRVGYSGAATFVHHVAASPEPVGSNRGMLARASREQFDRLIGHPA